MNRNKRFNIFDWIWIIPLVVGIILQIISIIRLKQANSDINFSVFSVIFRGTILTGAVTYIFYVLPRAIGYSKQKMKELKNQANFQEIQSKQTREEKLKLIKICKNCDNVLSIQAEKCNLCGSTEFINPNDKEIGN